MGYKSLNFNYKKNLNILKISQVLPYILLLYIAYLFIFNYLTPRYVFCDVNQITDIFKFIYCGDFEDYQLSIENIELLFSEMYTYQARPFLIVIVNFIYSFFSFISFSNFEKIIYSYIIFNFILIIFQLYLVVNYFLRKNYELSRLRICIASLILILNPVMKFSLTEITIQTGTIIIFLLSMNYFLNYESKYVFLLGLMYLFNGSSVFFVLIGALLLIITGVGSWRIMLSGVIGASVVGILFNLWGANSLMSFEWYNHLLVGGFAFGIVFMATDPVSAAQTTKGKWIYGFLVGVFCILIRVFNPAYPEGVMLAILLMNVFAPLIDHYVIETNVSMRRKRWRDVKLETT